MKRVLLVLVVLIVAAVAYVNSRPGTFRVERTARIAAPAESIFTRVDDLHRWASWSPWQKLDPNMVVTFSGPESGVGAHYHWTGNSKVGEGAMTITESEPGRKVGLRLDFIKPFAATNATAFTITPGEGGTNVAWTLDGKTNFVSKAMCIFTPMDKMIGPDFERGLASLKTESEAAPASAPADSTH